MGLDFLVIVLDEDFPEPRDNEEDLEDLQDTED